MSGTLFVVATPLGNMEDVTLRALRVLREADVIAAEDTRRTARLLAHHAITTPSLSFHQHNLRTRIPQLVSRLLSGQSVALVTDAGTPGVSDPGVELVAASLEAGIAVDPVPGPSAPLAAAVASGFPMIPLTIFAFPPRRSKDRTIWLREVASLDHTVTFFESPMRVRATLRELGSFLGERQIVVARELTKVYQEFLRGSVAGVLAQLSETRGEFTVVVAPQKSLAPLNDPGQRAAAVAGAVHLFGQLTDSGANRRGAMTEAARRYGLSARLLYAAVEAAKKSGE